MKPLLTVQVFNGKEYETLEVFGKDPENRRIKCTCLNGLFNPKRDHESKCKHARELKEKLSKYIIV